MPLVLCVVIVRVAIVGLDLVRQAVVAVVASVPSAAALVKGTGRVNLLKVIGGDLARKALTSLHRVTGRNLKSDLLLAKARQSRPRTTVRLVVPHLRVRLSTESHIRQEDEDN
jgi:hypothetical protein